MRESVLRLIQYLNCKWQMNKVKNTIHQKYTYWKAGAKVLERLPLLSNRIMNYQNMDEVYQSMDEIIMSGIINKYHKYEAFKLTNNFDIIYWVFWHDKTKGAIYRRHEKLMPKREAYIIIMECDLQSLTVSRGFHN